MASFKDHLKAEIFAETFSKIFFSGPAGRFVAIFFTIAYLFFGTVFTIASFVFKSVSKTLVAAASAYSNSKFGRRRKTARELKRAVRKFGDRLETHKGGDWVAYEISGTGFRFGEFSIALAHHSKTDAVRAFRSTDAGQSEIPAGEILGYCGHAYGFAKAEDFPTVYRNLRNHFL